MESDIIKIIIKEISDEATKSERNKLKDWMNEGNNRLIFYALKMYMNNKSPQTKNISDEVFKRVKRNINSQKPNITVQKNKIYNISLVWKVAAILIIAFGIVWYVNLDKAVEQQPTVNIHEIKKINPAGQKTTFKLPDGSMVNLNASSRLNFPSQFEGNDRIVVLEGEAFFDVKKDTHRPFIVKTGNITTTALGTSFNVKAYNDENTICVALLTGKVKVQSQSTSSQKDDGLTLTTNELASFDKKSSIMIKSTFDPKLELAWKNRTIYFDDVSFVAMTKTLERWYGVTFKINTKNEIDTRFTGRFKDKSLEYVLDVLSNNKETFSYTVQGENIIIEK